MSDIQRHDMEMYKVPEDEITQYVSLYLRDIGTVTVTLETTEWHPDKELTISIDFPIERLRIIDQFGNDRGFAREDHMPANCPTDF